MVIVSVHARALRTVGQISRAVCEGDLWTPGGARGPRLAQHGQECGLSLPFRLRSSIGTACFEILPPVSFTDKACGKLRLTSWGAEFTDLCGCLLLSALLPVRISELTPPCPQPHAPCPQSPGPWKSPRWRCCFAPAGASINPVERSHQLSLGFQVLTWNTSHQFPGSASQRSHHRVRCHCLIAS